MTYHIQGCAKPSIRGVVCDSIPAYLYEDENEQAMNRKIHRAIEK